MQAVSGSNTSVHTGCFTADYLLMNAKDTENSPRYAATGMANSMLSNKISTFFNLNGSSVTIDTACSSSLVALDMACKGLALGESSMVRVSRWQEKLSAFTEYMTRASSLVAIFCFPLNSFILFPGSGSYLQTAFVTALIVVPTGTAEPKVSVS